MTLLPGSSIDIVLPVYNNAEFLQRCLNSLASQSHQAHSIIIVDDCSTDPHVGDILREFATQHHNAQLLELDENVGICGAQNIGLSHATSDYIAFVDCDDWLREDALRIVHDAIISNRASYYFTDRVDVDGEAETVRVYGGQPQLIGRESHRDNLFDHMIASHLKVIEREPLVGIGGFQLGTEGVQDWDVALKLSEVVDLQYIPAAVYFHRVHSGQNSTYNKVENVRRTNIVRRAAANRRFGSTSIKPSNSFQLYLADLQAASPGLLDGLGASSVALVIDKSGRSHVLPQLSESFQRLAERVNIHEVLLFGGGPIFLGLLKDLWKLKPRPMIGFYLEDHDGYMSNIDSLRWNNSYFDFVVAAKDEGQVSLLGYVHEELSLNTLGDRGPGRLVFH